MHRMRHMPAAAEAKFAEERALPMRVRLLFVVGVSLAIWSSQWLLYERSLFPKAWHSQLYRGAELALCLGLLGFLARRQPLKRLEWVATAGLSLLTVAHAGAILVIAPDCVVPFTLTLEWGQMVIAFAALLSFWPTLWLLVTTWGVGLISTSIRAKWDTDFSDHIVLAGIYGVVLASIRGVDQLRRREFVGRHELDVAHRTLQAAERARSRLFVNLSHDFRTPLALIHGEAELLQRAQVGRAAQVALERIRLNASSLAELTNELLELARLEAGRTPITPCNFDLMPPLREICAQFAGREVALELDFAVDAPAGALADPLHVRRIVVNLIANAVRAAQRSVSVRCCIEGERVVVDVVDDGPGVPADRRLAIFERFTSFDASGSVASGIGLPVARELAELNGGSLWLVDGAPSTTFRVVLPCAIGPLVALPSAVPRDRAVLLPEAETLPRGNARADARSLLIVEDNADMRRLLQGLLSSDFRTRLANNVAEARRALAEETPDAILCDILLPDGDGFEVLSHVRAERHFDGVPLLFVSALATVEQRTRGLSAGVDDYVTKPFDAAELVARVRLACERAAERRRALDAQRRDFLAELHDGVTASLSRAALLLGAARKEGAPAALLEAANEAVRDGLNEARTVLSLTSAGTVPWLTVVERSRSELEEALSFGLTLEIDSQADGSACYLSAVEAHALERAARELVTNAVKHAQASALRASLVVERGRAKLTFSDNGVGLRLNANGSGLAILKRRIARLSGTLSVVRAAAGGTEAKLDFPLSLARIGGEPAGLTPFAFSGAPTARAGAPS